MSMSTSYANVAKLAMLTVDQDNRVWQTVMSFLDDDCVKPECRQNLESFIRNEAHVIIERENELLGQFVSPDYNSGEPRYLYVWLYHAGYSDEAGIADEYSAEEFDAQQTSRPATALLNLMLVEDHAWS